MQKPAIFDLTTKKGREALHAHFKKRGILYIPEDVPFIVMPIAVLGGDLGVVAARRLKAERKLGYYHGKIVKGDAAVQGSMYAFDVSKHEKEELFCDARVERNFAALVNHNARANLTATGYGRRVRFCVGERPISAYEQCFIDYGNEFFPMLGFKPRYLDPYDDWRSFDQVVLDNKTHYLDSTVYLSRELRKAFRLPNQEVLVTKLTKAILDGNEKETMRLIKSQANLWNYCAKKGKILPPERQQRFTALMLACYLGQSRVVQALLQIAHPNCQLLQTGETAIFFAIKGKAKKRLIINLLLDHGANVSLQNREGETLLNIAVEENLESVVHRVLQYKPAVQRDELLDLFCQNRTCDSLYHAITSQNWSVVHALFQYTTQAWLCTKISKILKPLKETSNPKKALQVLMEAANIHKNFKVVHAVMKHLGQRAASLLDRALKAKKWPKKHRVLLES